MAAKRFKLLPEMEGRTARWYARNRGTPSQLADWRRQASVMAELLEDGARILEIAPGPGYFAVELAKLGYRVTGVDISHTMVEIARETAQHAGVDIEFRQGDASALPFADASFDLIVCQAAFKNFTQPLAAIDEMYRVLRPGRLALIQDLSREAPGEAVDREVRAMKLGRFETFTTKLILGTFLRRRAYSAAQFERLVSESRFGRCSIRREGIGMEVRLARPAETSAAIAAPA